MALYDSTKCAKIIVLKDSTDFTLIGTHTWIVNESCTETMLDKLTIFNVSMSSCAEDQFTCKNGSCIGVKERCDGAYHCQDFSDEDNCNIMTWIEGGDNI